MPTAHREVERKYEPPTGAPLPSLQDLPGVAAVSDPVTHDLEAVYFDTDDLALASSGITVRRRTGGDDEGWHLKLPVGPDGRDELRLPLSRSVHTVPKPLRTTVRAYLLDRDTGPVATLRTDRAEYTLRDASGTTLATFCDDRVTGCRHRDEHVVEWREWEVELVDGDVGLLDAAEELLTEAGAEVAAGPSKLARALGGIPVSEADVLDPESPASAVVGLRLWQQVEELKRRDVEVRRDLPDGIHQMRVAMRRLRSALATFRPLVDRDVTDPIRDDLQWVGRVLGEARDSEVIHERLRHVLAEQPSGLVVGDVVRRLDAFMTQRHEAARDESVEALESERYLTLLQDLNRLVSEPPWTARAHEPASDVLPKRVRRDFKRLRKRVAAVDEATDPHERDLRLHEVRKAAKRARYAAETLTPVHGKPAERFVKKVKKVQSVLGEHQDSVVIQPLVLDLGAQAHQAGQSAFTYGRLHALEQTRAADSARRFEVAWRQASKKKHRAWL